MLTNSVVPIVPNPSLLIENNTERILVVGDFHIGWEISLMEKGIHIPSQTWRICDRLLEIVQKCEPTRIIFLGDVKHTIPGISRSEWKDAPTFFETVQNQVKDLAVITGNHDGDLKTIIPSSVKIYPSTGLVIGKKPRIGLFHGHAWPTPAVLSSDLLIMAHVHPVIWFKDKLGTWMIKQIWIKGRCNGLKLATAYLKYLKIKTEENSQETLRRKKGVLFNDPGLIIMPTFNDLIGGLSLNRFQNQLVGPLLGSGSVNIPNSEVYLLDGTYLGTITQIQTPLETSNL
jgi:putative SbcD/Mre11-related phosphoesterase